MRIITLCGSTDFFEEYDDAMLNLTIHGWAVFTIGTHRFNDKQLVVDKDLKEKFEKLHFDKIRLSDAIMVIDKNGYIGESTKREIKFASKYKKDLLSYSETKKHNTWKIGSTWSPSIP